MTKKHPAAVTLGRRGGRAMSERKAAAARENGRKGGAPRKPQTSIVGPARLRIMITATAEDIQALEQAEGRAITREWIEQELTTLWRARCANPTMRT